LTVRQMTLAIVGTLQFLLILSDILLQHAVSCEMVLRTPQTFHARIAVGGRVTPELALVTLYNLFGIDEPLPPYHYIFYCLRLRFDVAEACLVVGNYDVQW
jgi:hypothetical protein